MQKRIGALSDEFRMRASRELRERLEGAAMWQAARVILGYAPLAQEPDIWPCLLEAVRAGKRVLLPRFDAAAGGYEAREVRDFEKDIVRGQYGIREPSDGCGVGALNKLDFALVPGVSFDVSGRRLGRGRGYFDRLLEVICGVTCGVAFDEQIVREVPAESHDRVVNYVLTPTRWVDCGPRAVLE